MILSLIVAASENGAIGKDGGLPWHLHDDLKHFKEVTTGKPIIMGRKTYDSIGKPLPNRRNIVVTRDTSKVIEGCDVVSSVEDAVALVSNEPEAVIIGGAQVYAASLPHVTRLYFTRVHADVEGDVFFPEIDWSEWKKTASVEHAADERDDHAFTMETWERVK